MAGACDDASPRPSMSFGRDRTGDGFAAPRRRPAVLLVDEAPPARDRHVRTEQMLRLARMLQRHHRKVLIVEVVMVDPEDIGPITQPPQQALPSGHPRDRHLRVAVVILVDRHIPLVMRPVGVPGLTDAESGGHPDGDRMLVRTLLHALAAPLEEIEPRPAAEP